MTYKLITPVVVLTDHAIQWVHLPNLLNTNLIFHFLALIQKYVMSYGMLPALCTITTRLKWLDVNLANSEAGLEIAAPMTSQPAYNSSYLWINSSYRTWIHQFHYLLPFTAPWVIKNTVCETQKYVCNRDCVPYKFSTNICAFRNLRTRTIFLIQGPTNQVFKFFIPVDLKLHQKMYFLLNTSWDPDPSWPSDEIW